MPQADAPFVWRLGTPFLASLLIKDDLQASFKAVNIVANCIALALLVVWLRIYLKNPTTRLLICLAYIGQWLAPTRFVYFYPTDVDPWTFVFLLAGLIVMTKSIKSRSNLLMLVMCSVVFVGVLFREVVLVVPIAIVFSGNPIAFNGTPSLGTISIKMSKIPILNTTPIAAGIVGLVFTHMISRSTNDYSFLLTAASWAFDKPLITYVLAWFIAFGPVVVLILWNWRQSASFLSSNQSLTAYLLVLAAAGWLGGTDTERMILWSAPVVFVLIGRTIEQRGLLIKAYPLIGLILVAAQCISERVFWRIPNFPTAFSHSLPLLTPIGSHVPFLDLWSFHGSPMIEGVSFAEYLLLSLVLLLWLARIERKAMSLQPKEL
jgi:hypothetical protein